MTNDSTTTQLLAGAAERGGQVVGERLGRAVTVNPGSGVTGMPLLRFDIQFEGGGILRWYLANDDATGMSDLLVGGVGDRSAQLSETHLDALSTLMSGMLEEAAGWLAATGGIALAPSGVDMGMEPQVLELGSGAAEWSCVLDVDGFGGVAVTVQADPGLAGVLAGASAPGAAGGAAPAAAAPAAGNAPAAQVPVSDVGGTVVPLRGSGSVSPGAAATSDLGMFMDVPLDVSVEFGRTSCRVRDLLELNVGSILELDKLNGEPMDIFVNGSLLARGEVVVIDEEYGIRITEIGSPSDRLRGIG